jgi:cation diffusion facilitator family transporter
MTGNRATLSRRGSIIGVAGNAILALMKVFTGFFTGSMAILADGADSTTDILTSVITWISTSVSNKPPDAQHPYGHERADAVASKIVSMVIFFAGAQLAMSSVQKLFTGTSSVRNLTLVITVASISAIAKYLLYRYKLSIGKKIDSSVFIADAMNMKLDILISLSVLGGSVFVGITGLQIVDTIVGLAVSALVIKTSIEIFWETNYELMDGMKPDDNIYKIIFDALKRVPDVYNPHKVRVRKMGYKYLVDLDIEVNPRLTVRKAHFLAKQVEAAIKKDKENVYDVHVHVEPSGNVEDENFGIDSSNEFSHNDDQGQEIDRYSS